ncbi:MAG: biosynthetic arginine decarboxylase, partial [Deltaproteobacteria bacterium]|nr:biosynthetic arginine decarboxylase [Deltaproteobacteria bacterium]
MARQKPRVTDPMRRWSIADSADTYGTSRWTNGYFSINDSGNLAVTPHGPEMPGADLKALVDEIKGRGIKLPIILRFPDILKARIELLNNAFALAMTDCEYKGDYRGVYPIKVNQARKIVEEIIEFGAPHHYGLEAGSKPELLAVMAVHKDPKSLIICNGYKDEQYIEAALLASKLGRTVVQVIEKPSELDHILEVSTRLGIDPALGIRVRLSARGAGRWQESGGDRSKFGLSASEMVEVVGKLQAWGKLDTLRLLHFHLGSQISAIRSIKNALREAARYYAELRNMGCGHLDFLDVGGGLGVDYDGSQTNFSSSMNYTVQEYANDVVFETMQVCDHAGVPHPTIVTESGRAVSAHHSVLIVDVLEVSSMPSYDLPSEVPEDASQIVHNLFETYSTVNRKNFVEAYHDSVEYKDQALA